MSRWTLCVMAMAGCAKHSFVVGPRGMSGPPDYERWHSGLLWGIVELDQTDLAHVCGGEGVSGIYDHQDVLNWLVTALTGGIYQASTVRVWCAEDASAMGLPPAEGSELDVVISADGQVWLAQDALPSEARPVATREVGGTWR